MEYRRGRIGFVVKRLLAGAIGLLAAIGVFDIFATLFLIPELKGKELE